MSRRDGLAIALRVAGIVMFARFVAEIPVAYMMLAQLGHGPNLHFLASMHYYRLLTLLARAVYGVGGAILFLFGGWIARLLMRRDAPLSLGGASP